MINESTESTKNVKKRVTILLTQNQLDALIEIGEAEKVDGLSNIIRHCISLHYASKYEWKKYKSAAIKQEKEIDPGDNMPFTELCEYLGGSVIQGSCKIRIASKVNPAWGNTYAFSQDVLRNDKFPAWKKNNKNWDGILI